MATTSGGPSSTLELTSLTLTDAGYYACRANNDYGAILSSEAHINVKGNKPMTHNKRTGQFIYEGIMVYSLLPLAVYVHSVSFYLENSLFILVIVVVLGIL